MEDSNCSIWVGLGEMNSYKETKIWCIHTAKVVSQSRSTIKVTKDNKIQIVNTQVLVKEILIDYESKAIFELTFVYNQAQAC